MREFFGRLPAPTRERLLAAASPSEPPDLAQACREAGFAAATVTAEEFPATVESLDRWWELQWTHGFRGFLREFDEATLGEMRARAFELLGPQVTATGEVEGVQSFVFCAARCA
jgi:hypothetical protein